MAAAAQEDMTLAMSIKADIAKGLVSDGEGRLPPERAMAERYEVSRTRLRRALTWLEEQGVIYRRQGKGTFAAPPQATAPGSLTRLARDVTPNDIMEVRLAVEPALASLAARHASNEEIARLGQMMEATLNLSERAAYENADDNFHYRIAVLARNPLFLQVYESIRTVRKLAAWGLAREESHTPVVMRRFGEQHRALFDAIASRDMARAGDEMERHLLDVHHVLTHGHIRHAALSSDAEE